MPGRIRVRHLSSDELSSFATGVGTDSSTARHVERCGSCAAAVVRLQVGLAGVLAVSVRSGAPRADCLDEHRIAGFVDATASSIERDSALAHIADCARCRAAVSSVTRARSAQGVADTHDRFPATARRRWARYALPLGAAAAIASLLLIRGPASPDPEPHRAVSVAAGATPVAISPVGPTASIRVLRWHAVRGADRYRVTIFDEAGLVVYEATSADTVVALPATVEIPAGRPHYWIVAARTDFDRWESSALAEFSVTGSPR
jgi:hypothetical protein